MEQTWEEWLEEHKKSCETCRKAFEDVDGDGMCEVAFEKFKEYLKEEQDKLFYWPKVLPPFSF